jgi:hypothetical protein
MFCTQSWTTKALERGSDEAFKRFLASIYLPKFVFMTFAPARKTLKQVSNEAEIYFGTLNKMLYPVIRLSDTVVCASTYMIRKFYAVDVLINHYGHMQC